MQQQRSHLMVSVDVPTCEGEDWGEDDVDPSTMDVKHDAKVDGYAAQDSKAVHKSPVGGVQGNLINKWVKC